MIHPVPEPGQRRLGGEDFFFQCGGEYGICGKFIGTVIFEICSNDLIDHLHQVVRIRMYSERCRIIGLEKLLHKLNQADLGCKLLDEEKATIRGKIAAVEIYFDLLIAFKRKGV